MKEDEMTWKDLGVSIELSMSARGRSPRTISNYIHTLWLFAEFCHGPEPSERPVEFDGRDVDRFMADQLRRHRPGTAATRWRHLQQIVRWLMTHDHLKESPLKGRSAPFVPDTIVPVLTTGELKRLLASCSTDSFRDRRDTAIIRLFVDTGMRLSEAATLRVQDLALSTAQLTVIGKGGHQRRIAFGTATARAMGAYLSVRAQHRDSSAPALWLGLKGPMTSSGIAQVIKRRARMAGIPDCHPHRFRHTFAHRWLLEGGSETDLLTLAGWRTTEMLNRYGASARQERALAAQRRLRLGEAI